MNKRGATKKAKEFDEARKEVFCPHVRDSCKINCEYYSKSYIYDLDLRKPTYCAAKGQCILFKT